MLPERFEKKIVRVPFSGCWIWMGASTGRYGHAWDGARVAPAHRVILALVGIHVPDGLEVLHSCDIGHCVNPDHLSIGTHQDNMSDMVRKGRSRAPCGDSHWSRADPERARAIARANIVRSHASGFANSNAKATPEIIASVRMAHALNPDLTMEAIGAPYGIGRETTRKIVRGIAPWTL